MSKTVCFITRNFGKYDPDSLRGYESIGGFRALRKALTMEGYAIADVLAANGVQGRGGAAYDMGKKWRQAREVPGAHKCVVCNADEGEPGTFKDRELLTHDPFQLLEGMIIAGWAVGADNGYIYLREEYSHLRPRLLSAIAQCEAAGYLGEDILGSGLNYRIHLYSGAGAYVCGEGSALAESIGGHAGRPRMKPPFIKQCGVFHLPTCVNNVESLSLVAPLLLDDEGYYKSQGTPDCPGTKMISVCGNVKRPGVFEVPFGITIREIVYDLAGGMENEDYPLRLVQLGGASGRICSPAQLDTPLLVMEGTEFSSEMVSMREQPIEIIIATYTGLKVPKSAVRVQEQTDSDGKTTQIPGVFILSGSIQKFKMINELFEADDYYVVKQSATDSDMLVERDQVIVQGKNLQNNMVVKT